MSWKKLNRLFLTILIIVYIPTIIKATHNRAGEITYVQLSDNYVRAIVTTYTKTSSSSADRDTITISWGDGSFSSAGRTNGNGTEFPNDIKKNIYIAEHQYPGRGTYDLGMVDPNRIDNILNIDPPNSVNIPFYIQSTITLFNTTFQGINHSPILLQAPIDFACLYQTFTHNPSAFDEDGDSLAYELVIPLMDRNLPVPNYLYPNQIKSGLNNNIYLDQFSGTFIWNAPQMAGEYNIAIAIYEFRKGILIGKIIRDMEILVQESCSMNSPPVITTIQDTCVIAGTYLEIPILINDADIGNKGGFVKVEAAGAPFVIINNASVLFPSGFNKPLINGKFIWQTNCTHIRKEYYNVTIKATDNFFDTTGLSTTQTIRIKIIGPPPIDLKSKINNNKVELNWNKPYVCDFDSTNFRGFSVWRKIKSQSLIQDTCNPGLEHSNYQKIAFLINSYKLQNYFYIDSNIIPGQLYCYRIQAEFAKISTSGFPYNFVGSLASNESCNYLQIDKPILLNVDVFNTDPNLGSIDIKWAKPNPNFYDTILHQPPYTIKLFYSYPNSSLSEILSYTKTYSSYSNVLDTNFTHKNLSTDQFPYQYLVQFISSDGFIAQSDSSESIYLKTKNQNGSVQLTWSNNTPWSNYLYSIFRKEENSVQFDSIGQSSTTQFIDLSAEQQKKYCYYVTSYGSYGFQGIDSILINHSNISCIKVMDDSPPCCPQLSVKGSCDENNNSELFNTLSWNNPNVDCPIKDVVGYEIYKLNKSNQRELLIKINDPTRLNYIHEYTIIEPLCYEVISIDSSGKQCESPIKICANYCPAYELPNTFTPNGDGHNDIFKPIKNKFIERVEFQVVNQWGELVFRTEDPNLNWNGTNLKGSILSDGVYYYSCKILPYPSTQPLKDLMIKGFIELLKGK